MLIYKDIFSGDELCSDSFPMKLVDGVVYEFTGKFVSRKAGDVVLAGSNPSEEDPDDVGGGDEFVEKGIDIVLNHSLMEMTEVYSDSAAFKDWVKEYLKKLLTHLKSAGKSDAEITEFKTKIQTWVAGLMKKDRFKELQFFSGPGDNAADGQLGIMEWRDVNGTQLPIFMLVKAGLEEEKC